MELARQRAQVRVAAARRKEEEKKAKGKEGASLLTHKVVRKGAPKRKVFFLFFLFVISWFNARHLSFTEMELARQMA